MKYYADMKRKDVSYEEGEWVYLKVQPHRQKTWASCINEKLSLRFYGPYKILQKVGRVAYKLELPKDCQIHPVFHVSQLKKVEGIDETATAPPPLRVDLELLVQPADILQVRQLQSRPHKVLVLWEGLHAFEATWEDVTKVFTAFPNTQLEDKVLNWAGGIVTTKAPEIIKT